MTEIKFGRIAVATDGSPHAERALDIAIDLARRYGSTLTILGVAPLVPLYIGSTEAWVPTEIPDTELQQYRQLVDRSVDKAKSAGLSAVTGVCLEGVIVDEIIAHLEQSPVDLLVLGSRGLSTARRLLLGSVSDAVVHHAPCPVLIVRPEPGASK